MNAPIITPERTAESLSTRDIVGWVCLLGLVISICLPRTTAVTNGLGALSVLVLGWCVRCEREDAHGRLRLIPNPLLRYALLIYAGSVALSVAFPALLNLPDLTAFKQSLHPLWHTIRAVAAAGLCLVLLRKPVHFAIFFGILGVVVAAICVWNPLHHPFSHAPHIAYYLNIGKSSSWWGAYLDLRPSGTRGYPVLWATLLYLLSYPLLMLLATPRLRRVELPMWAISVGYSVAIIIPFWLLRKKWAAPEGTTNFYLITIGLGLAAIGLRHTKLPRGLMWLLYMISVGVVPAIHGWWSILPEKAPVYVYLACGANLIGVLAWSGLWRMGKPRTITVMLILFFILVNIALSLTRTHTLLFILLCGFTLSIGRINLRKILPGITVLAIIMGAFLIANPRQLLGASMRHRLYIWDGTISTIKDRWLLGHGYGPVQFTTAWQAHKPNPATYEISDLGAAQLNAPAHAHSLWLELLVERGVMGAAAFLLLWITLLLYLVSASRAPPKATDDAESSPTPQFAEDQSLRVVVRLSVVFLLLLQLEGLLEYSPTRGNEILMWLVAAMGIAASKICPLGKEFLAKKAITGCR